MVGGPKLFCETKSSDIAYKYYLQVKHVRLYKIWSMFFIFLRHSHTDL